MLYAGEPCQKLLDPLVCNSRMSVVYIRNGGTLEKHLFAQLLVLQSMLCGTWVYSHNVSLISYIAMLSLQ